MNNLKAAVVIPTLDNDTIQVVVDDARSFGYDVIVVDDGCRVPITQTLRDDKKVHIITHHENIGKGEALYNGAKKAKELGYKYFVSMDADGQHLAKEIRKLTNAINEGDDIIVIGARDFNIANVPDGSKIGRAISNFWAILNTSINITDSLSGFRLYPISILDLPTKAKKFDYEIEVIVRHSWLKKKIKEVVIQCYYPTAQERVSHFRKWRDTTSIVLLHMKLLPQRIIFLRGFI